MLAKALEVGTLAKSGRCRRTLGKWVLAKCKKIPRHIEIEKHSVLAKYTVTEEVVR